MHPALADLPQMRTRIIKIAVWTVVVLAGIGTTIAIVKYVRKTRRITLQGAVVRKNSDPNKQLPVSDVEVTAITGSPLTGRKTITAKTDASGSFTLMLPRGLRRRQPVTLNFRHPDYHPLDLNEFVSDKLYIIRMEPTITEKPQALSDHPAIVVANVRVRYSEKTTTTGAIGSAVKTFQIVNLGNVPCQGERPCSPDGRWKATTGKTSLDAGDGNEFRNVRVTCIAGPCPFASVESQDLSRDGRVLDITARDWSDTVTFVVEAEVVHRMVSDLIRNSYPVIFGRSLTFSLPASAEGPSIEAEINGQPVVFPLGPQLFLSWAQCTLGMSKESNRVYRCELKAGYRFP